VRAGSAFPALAGSRSSAERYIPNSASDAFESFMMSKRAASVAVAAAREAELNNAASRIEDRVRRREYDRLDRQRRAKTGKFSHFLCNKKNRKCKVRFTKESAIE
jgi:hypothetical protein